MDQLIREKKKKSIGINALISGLKTIISLIFPLLTYPYITRVLGVENIGKYNFSYHVVDYFCLLCSLGIGTYTIREGSKLRKNKKIFSDFASEVFTINIISTIFSYILLVLAIFISSKLQKYSSEILILSINMIFITIGCEWIYAVYEEYLYIAVRTIIFQIISLILLFTLVKNEEDLLLYCFTVVIGISGANIINVIGLKKYVKLRLVFNKRIAVHFIPIIILFANSVATRIYVSSDIVILGLLTTDYNVGIYSIASKIYSIVKQVLSAIIIVSIPRLSLLLGENNREEYNKLVINIFYSLLTFVLPAITGLYCMRKDIILFVSNTLFLSSEGPLKILSLALFFCLFNWFFTSCVLIPHNKEKEVLFATTVAAIINIALNFILIPKYMEKAVAFTTLIAELTSLIICLKNSKSLVKIEARTRDIISVIIGCFVVQYICRILNSTINSSLKRISLAIFLSVISYIIVLFMAKNSVFDLVLKRYKNSQKDID